MTSDAVFGAFPQLKTRRLLLREIREDDVADVYAIFSDPEVMTYYNCEPIPDLAAANRMIEKISERWSMDFPSACSGDI